MVGCLRAGEGAPLTVTRVRAPNRANGLHLEKVRREMVELGSPTIRVWDGRGSGPLDAIEGSHRLAAASELGVPVKLKRVRPGDVVYHDFVDLVNPCPIEWVLEYLRQGGDERGLVLEVQVAEARRPSPGSPRPRRRR